ncbi:MAG TPA: DinB family protein [Chitinophagaceae bacterium]|nr:DinB family protein [Chitinophagaceae bacterium]
MDTKKWFNRQFDFNTTSDLAAICKRLEETPAQLQNVCRHIADTTLEHKPGNTWSVKEHIGHLSLLEPLWRTRFEDISQGKAQLTPADLENRATSAAGFNNYSISTLLEAFKKERALTLTMLERMNADDLRKTSLHPRLQQQMRIADLAYFVAEHDAHHLERILQLKEQHE